MRDSPTDDLGTGDLGTGDLGTGAGGRFSVAFPRRWWYPACRSRDLRRRPLAIQLMETPLAVFRDGAGQPRALLDRCPHRNYPLSQGAVTGDGTLECGYHGWQFDGCGGCVAVPGLGELGSDAAASPTRSVPAHATREQDGFVWVWGEPGVDEADAGPGQGPDHEPLALPTLDGPGRNMGEVVFRYDLDSTLHAALENALDVPHTAFLHGGKFRGTGDTHEITAVRRPLRHGIEVEYLGEPVGFGPIRRRRRDGSPDGGGLTFDHWDRFLMPSTAQIEYRVAGWLRIVNTILHLPLSPFRTRAWFVVRYSSRLPAALARPLVRARGIQILRQDAKALARQTEHVRSFGGERYTSTELDLMGNAIWRMLRHAERAERGEHDEHGAERGNGDRAGGGTQAEPVERTVTFRV